MYNNPESTSAQQPSLTLREAFAQTNYILAGNGDRNIHVLQQAFADINGDLASDMYGRGPVIEDFQKQMADVLGKESAVFFPTGTMAQQIALRIWCDRKNNRNVAYHPLCHLEIHEEDGLKELHHIQSILLADQDRLITLADVQQMDQKVACLLLELPQREIGGQLPAYSELQAISAYCREQGILLHLDGARLFEILPYYQKTAAEVCALFDSVYISFYKGIGGIAGAILAGPSDFTAESKVWKRRHGGDLISLYPYILSSKYYYEQRVGKMEQYYKEAVQLAHEINQCTAVHTLPEVPVSNMFHIYFELPKEQIEPILIEMCQATNVGLAPYLTDKKDGTQCSTELSIGDRYGQIPLEHIQQALHWLDQRLKEVSANQ